MTQEDRVLDFLQVNETITGKEASDELAVTRLPEIIRRLKEHGHVITDEWVTGQNRFGEEVRFKKWRLAE